MTRETLLEKLFDNDTLLFWSDREEGIIDECLEIINELEDEIDFLKNENKNIQTTAGIKNVKCGLRYFNNRQYCFTGATPKSN